MPKHDFSENDENVIFSCFRVPGRSVTKTGFRFLTWLSLCENRVQNCNGPVRNRVQFSDRFYVKARPLRRYSAHFTFALTLFCQFGGPQTMFPWEGSKKSDHLVRFEIFVIFAGSGKCGFFNFSSFRLFFPVPKRKLVRKWTHFWTGFDRTWSKMSFWCHFYVILHSFSTHFWTLFLSRYSQFCLGFRVQNQAAFLMHFWAHFLHQFSDPFLSRFPNLLRGFAIQKVCQKHVKNTIFHHFSHFHAIFDLIFDSVSDRISSFAKAISSSKPCQKSCHFWCHF